MKKKCEILFYEDDDDAILVCLSVNKICEGIRNLLYN